MHIRNILIAVIVISFMILGSISYLTNMQIEYGQSINSSIFPKSESALNKTINYTEKLKSDIMGTTLPGEETGGYYLSPYKMIKTAWDAMGLVSSSFSLMTSFFGEGLGTLSQILHIPGWTLLVVIGIIVIIVVFIFIELFFKWRLES